MKLAVLGAGMYVTGRGGLGPGVVLASLAQATREFPIDEVVVAARNADNARVLADATARINGLLGTHLGTRYERFAGDDHYADTNALCRANRFDGAIVATPDALHFDASRALIEARVPLLVVKPLTTSLRQAYHLVAMQKTYRVHGAVEFHKRYDECNLYARRILREGRLGTPLYATVEYSQRIVIPTRAFREWVGRTNIFQYLGVHYVDMLYFLTGYRPTRVTALGTSGRLRELGVDADDSIHVTIEWENPDDVARRFVARFDTNWVDPECTSAMSDQKYTVVGTLGRVECDQKHRGLEVVQSERGVEHPNPYFADFLPDGSGGLCFQGYGFRSIRQFLVDIVDLRAGRVTPEALELTRPSFREALVTTAALEAVNRSLTRPHRWVNVRGLS